MLAIPSALQSKFNEQLRIRSISSNLHGPYQKWLRYYLDFCRNYRFPPRQDKNLPPFIRKLQEKQQLKTQREQAAEAIKLYYEILRETGIRGKAPSLQPSGFLISTPSAPVSSRSAPTSKIQNASGPSSLPGKASPLPATMIAPRSLHAGPGTGISWKAGYAQLANEIRFRHYSPKTLRTYRGWVKQFHTITHSKDTAELSTDDVFVCNA